MSPDNRGLTVMYLIPGFYVSLLTDTTVSSETKPLRTFAFS